MHIMKNPAAVAMAKLRAEKLGPVRTKEIASGAASSRWARMNSEDRKTAMAKVMAGRKNLKKPASDGG